MRRLIEECAGIEETIGAVYRHWATTQRAGEELLDLWKGMSRDEEQHAQQLRLAGRLLMGEGVAGVDLDDEEVARLRQQACQILDRVRGTDMTPQECLDLVRQMENDFRKVHARVALQFSEGDLKRLFDHLAKEDQRHLTALECIAAK